MESNNDHGRIGRRQVVEMGWFGEQAGRFQQDDCPVLPEDTWRQVWHAVLAKRIAGFGYDFGPWRLDGLRGRNLRSDRRCLSFQSKSFISRRLWCLATTMARQMETYRVSTHFRQSRIVYYRHGSTRSRGFGDGKCTWFTSPFEQAVRRRRR